VLATLQAMHYITIISVYAKMSGIFVHSGCLKVYHGFLIDNFVTDKKYKQHIVIDLRQTLCVF